MSYQKLLRQMIEVTLVLLLLVGCGAPAATSVPPAATPAPPAATPVPPTAAPNPTPEPTPIPALFSIYQNEKSGYIDASGQIVIQFQFDDAGSFFEGLAAVKVGSLWGYIDATGTTVIQPQFDSAGSFSEGLAAVRAGSLWGYIDATGTMMIQPSFERASPFYGGRARIGIDDKYGYIDSTGKIMVAAVYDGALDFSEVVAGVMTCTQQKPCKTFTLTGSWGTITNRTGGQWSFIDPDGDTVIPATFDDAGKFSGGLAPVKLGESWGYVDKTGAMVIRPQFDDGLDFSEELAAVKIGEKWGYIDNTGAIAIPLQFDSAHGFSDGLAAVAMGQGMDQKWGYIDKTGAMVIQPQFLLGDSFSQGLVQVQLDDGSGGLTFAYVNDTGEYVWKGSTSTLPPAEATPTPELTLPPIPDEFPRTDEAECEWQNPILGSWSRKLEDQSTETVTFKPDHTLFFTYGDKPNQVRVGTFICEKGGTLKIFTQSYVEGKPDWTLFLGRIEITFPSPDTLKMDVKTANEVWTYERIR